MFAQAYFAPGRPSGGLRASGLLTTVYHVRAKSRARRDARAKAERRDPYIAAGSRNDGLWSQSCRAEAAAQTSQVAAGIYWGLTSFFEAVKLDDLYQRLRATGYPPVVAAMSLGLFAVGP